MDLPDRFRIRMAAAGILLILAGPGCTSVKPASDPFAARGRHDFSSRRLPDVRLDAIQPSARKTFTLYFRVDPAASSDNLWVSYPAELSERGRPERVRDVLGVSERRHRQFARLQIIQDGPDVLAQCLVRNQRLDSSERAAFDRTRGRQGDDRPTETPIDRRDAAATSWREEWVDVGRDRHTENLILDAIVQAMRPNS